MDKNLQNFKIAEFALGARYENVGESNIDQLKRHLLDAIGSMVYASTRAPIKKLLNQLNILAEGGACETLAGKLPYDRAAQLYTALVRYPDFMDNYMGKEATCHPSDNLGPLLAASHFRDASGRDLLTAMAVAYQIQCRLVEEIPVMKEGIDHTLLVCYSMTASAARLFDLTVEQTAHALGIAGCSLAAMVTSRASYTYEWKGFASSMDALDCVNVILLAKQGMTGPVAIFEGPKGFGEIFGMKLDYDWQQENFELVHKCVLKRYNAEVHSQATLEALLDLQRSEGFSAADIEKIEISTFLTAYHIIGGGAYGDRKSVDTKEQADHSLPYLAAVALLDGEVYPAQFEPGRIRSRDVQELLQKVNVGTVSPIHKPVTLAGVLDPYTRAYPDKMKTKVEVHLKGGSTCACEKEDYEGFFSRPFGWEQTIGKFRRLCDGIVSESWQDEAVEIVQNLDKLPASQLTGLLARIGN
ncbi:MAG: MmgE/PrpD family protein [Chitinophagaceae bacterium]|nr:MmgE/PrpD family protein [Chitinophagaceae bacterium]